MPTYPRILIDKIAEQSGYFNIPSCLHYEREHTCGVVFNDEDQIIS